MVAIAVSCTVPPAPSKSVTSGETVIESIPVEVQPLNGRTRLSMLRGARTVGMPGEALQLRVNGTSGENGAKEDMTDNVKWTSSDESVATVSGSGLVTGVGRGSATIMAILTSPDRTAVAAGTVVTVTGSGR